MDEATRMNGPHLGWGPAITAPASFCSVPRSWVLLCHLCVPRAQLVSTLPESWQMAPGLNKQLLIGERKRSKKYTGPTSGHCIISHQMRPSEAH